jgi:Ca2+-binding EF-hand superfamily protein
MRRLLPYLLPCVLFANLSATADDSARLLTDLDANHDGLLTRQEAGKENGLLFDRLVRTSDEDGDGRLTAEEFAAGLQPVRAEKPQVEKQGNRMPGGDALVVMVAKMDVDHDRQLTAKEIPDRYQAVFEQMVKAGDDNKDGKLDSREIARQAPQIGMVAMVASRQMGIDVAAELAKLPKADVMAMDQMDAYAGPGKMMADPAQAEERFARLDADGNGKISAEEAPPQMAERFDEILRRADHDGDSQLSLPEFKEMSKRMAQFDSIKVDPQAVKRTVRQLLDNFDLDHDGQLSQKEAPRRLADNFDRADQDSNGKLDADELQRAAETMQRMQKQFGGPRPGGFAPAGMAAKQPGRGKKRPAAEQAPGGKRPQKAKNKAFDN